MTSDPFDDSVGVLIIADDPMSAAEANDAAGMAGARVLGTVSWDEARRRVTEQVAPATLLIEAAQVSEEAVARVLPGLVTDAGAQRLIVSFSTAQLDQVSAILIGSEAALLCDPSRAERVAALVIARNADATDVRDSREEAARLARINAEVARFTQTLAQLTGTAHGPDATADRPAIVGDRHSDFAQPSTDIAVSAADLRRAIRARRLRDETVGLPGLFEDPAWDMLLDLFAAELERSQVSVSSLCIAAAVAPTTALRWINKLIEVGLFERRPDSFDRRRAYIALTPRGSAAMRDYVAALRRAGLSIA